MSQTLPTIDHHAIAQIANEASSAIMNVYYTDFEVTSKDDHSPLTKADSASNRIIEDGLRSLFPDIPIVSEETDQTSYENRKAWSVLWVVDPLDGTKEFVKRNGEFTINIALVSYGVPIWGMIYVPISGDAYYAAKDSGANRISKGISQSIRSSPPDKELIVAASRSHFSPHFDKYVMHMRTQFDKIKFISAGSALKFCLVAEGRAHLYPRFGTTMEWDTAAGQILVEEAGGRVLDMKTLSALNYNKEDLRNPSFVGMGSDLTSYLPIL